MTIEIPVSSTYTLVVEHSQFNNGAPCIAVRMMFVGDGEPQQRGHMRFDRKSVPSVLEAIERVARSM